MYAYICMPMYWICGEIRGWWASVLAGELPRARHHSPQLFAYSQTTKKFVSVTAARCANYRPNWCLGCGWTFRKFVRTPECVHESKRTSWVCSEAPVSDAGLYVCVCEKVYNNIFALCKGKWAAPLARSRSGLSVIELEKLRLFFSSAGRLFEQEPMSYGCVFFISE